MAQFDVFVNPIVAARATLPYVVVLQSDITATSEELIVAPISSRPKAPGSVGRLMPSVKVDGKEHFVVTMSLTTLPPSMLKKKVANLAEHRSELLGAIDLIFFGI